jgi:NADH:ubiquinone oxidoreductase subunit 5 (subunit L)/multisubunit Na+/H+ antiporter MnhA subunit
LWLWPILATARLRAGVRQHWKRILVGAVVGWMFAVVGGAIALATLEFHNVITRSTSDELGIVLVLYGVGVGALNAYALRPAAEQ